VGSIVRLFGKIVDKVEGDSKGGKNKEERENPVERSLTALRGGLKGGLLGGRGGKGVEMDC